ncbi:hypothetical protein BDA99DRAFT_502080 [Phascolomyces articulosus]|uniref:Uncharacterized protein n=1 Tax=Phascolomyces articulosus TaxID=60185 RepID=A0AAD5K5K4_9FUNG|nr:hypothetical protein BDA99DRAFT_502080 [Phascolomyces articulosus]
MAVPEDNPSVKDVPGPTISSEGASSSATLSTMSTPSTIHSMNSSGNTIATSTPTSTISLTSTTSMSYPVHVHPPPPATVAGPNRMNLATTQGGIVSSTPLPAVANVPYTMLHSTEDDNHYARTGPSGQNSGITDIEGGAQSTTQTVDTAARSVQAIAQDIEDLQVNVEALADDLGINPGQLVGNGDFSGYYDQFTDDYSRLIASATQHDRNQLFELASHRYHLQKQQHNNNGNHPPPPTPFINTGGNNTNNSEINGVSTTYNTTFGSFPYHPASAFLRQHYQNTSDGTAMATTGASTNTIPQNKTSNNLTRWSTDATYAYNLACSFLQQQLANRTIAARRACSASRPHRVPSPVLRTSVESSFCTSSAPSSAISQQQQQQPANGVQPQQQQQPALVPVPVPVPVAMIPTANNSQQAQQYQAQFAQQLALQQQQFPVLSEDYMAFLTAQAQQTYVGMAAAAAANSNNVVSSTTATTMSEMTTSTIAHPQESHPPPELPSEQTRKHQ